MTKNELRLMMELYRDRHSWYLEAREATLTSVVAFGAIMGMVLVVALAPMHWAICLLLGGSAPLVCGSAFLVATHRSHKEILRANEAVEETWREYEREVPL